MKDILWKIANGFGIALLTTILVFASQYLFLPFCV